MTSFGLRKWSHFWIMDRSKIRWTSIWSEKVWWMEDTLNIGIDCSLWGWLSAKYPQTLLWCPYCPLLIWSRLHTEEKMKNYNRTIKFGPGSQPEFYSKKTTSGLWTICVSKGLNNRFNYHYKVYLFFSWG